MSSHPSKVMLVGSDGLGRGDEELGRLLMPRFLHELCGVTEKPEYLLFVNNGVRLVADDSLVLEQLRRLQVEGVDLLACSTCLERFDLTDRLAVGSRTDMPTIASILVTAEKVVSL